MHPSSNKPKRIGAATILNLLYVFWYLPAGLELEPEPSKRYQIHIVGLRFPQPVLTVLPHRGAKKEGQKREKKALRCKYKHWCLYVRSRTFCRGSGQTKFRFGREIRKDSVGLRWLKGVAGGRLGESVVRVLVLREAESEAESRGAEVGRWGTAVLKLRERYR